MKVNGLSLDKVLAYDESLEPEADAVDTLNELSLSQAVLEEAPLPDTAECKRSLNTFQSPKDYQARMPVNINIADKNEQNVLYQVTGAEKADQYSLSTFKS